MSVISDWRQGGRAGSFFETHRGLLAGGAAFVGALDGTAGVFAAYSSRRLRAAYTGKAIRVRESSGNTEADIGFTPAGDLDEAALSAHIGANSGFVVTRYDQSGNGLDLTQATTANQPRIASSGTIDKSPGGRPWTVLDGTNDFMSRASVAWAGGPMTIFAAVHADSVASSYRRLLTLGNAAAAGVEWLLMTAGVSSDWLGDDGVVYGDGSNAGRGPRVVATTPGLSDGAIHQHDLVLSAADVDWSKDGGSLTERVAVTGDVPAITATLTLSAASFPFQGKIGELVMIAGAPARAAFRANQKSYWGTP